MAGTDTSPRTRASDAPGRLAGAAPAERVPILGPVDEATAARKKSQADRLVSGS